MLQHLASYNCIPDRVNGTPLDLVVAFALMAAIERDQVELGISQEQVYRIADRIAPVVEQYLISPARAAALAADEATS